MNGHTAKEGEDVVVPVDEPTPLVDRMPVTVTSPRREPMVDKLVDKITDENHHGPCDWGTAHNRS